MFVLFVFQVWVRCFQLIGPLVDLLHFIFEIADMSIPRIFGHSIAPLAADRHTPYHATGTRGAHMQPRLVGRDAEHVAAATALWNVSEFLRRELSLQGGNGAGARLYLETNPRFLVRLAEHVDVLTDVGEHAFLAVGNDELHLSQVIEEETHETGVKCLDVLGIQRGHRNGLGELFFQQCLLRNIDGVDLV